MFHPQKSFEKSLRSSPSSGSYQVPIITPLKPEVHKGCTGKAHACGSIKSTTTVLANKSTSPVKPKAKNDNKTLRKNSLSSETVSDSGSESWNSNKDNLSGSSIGMSQQQLPPKPLKRTKSVNNECQRSICSSSAGKRRTSDSIIITSSIDITDNLKPQNKQRGRLMSDGEGKTDAPTEEISRLKRSSSFRKNIPPFIPPKPNNSKIIHQITTSPLINKQRPNGNFNNGRLRNSFRGLKSQNQVANWNDLWETSLSTKLGGGNYRNIDKRILNSNLKTAPKVI